MDLVTGVRTAVSNPRHACTVRVTVVGSACVSVNQYLTSRASFCPENNITYSMGNKNQKICVDFSETSLLQTYTASCIAWLSVQSAIFGNCACALLVF